VINRYSHPTLAWVLDYWPVTIFLPSILLLIAVLALITRRWDEHDAAREMARRGANSAEAMEVADRVTLSEPTGG
jgi:hypothetical protein